MEAYFDNERKVWVFPGEDPAEVAKPLPPPPISMPAATPESPPSPKVTSNDPLAAMMAPPQRGPSALRGVGRPSSYKTPGSSLPPTGTRIMPSGATPTGLDVPAAAPPNFSVFQPKLSAETSESDKDGEDS